MTAPPSIRVLIVDDEAPARARIRRMLSKHKDFQIVEECSGGIRAVAAIQALRPDLVFLDVQMPDLDGFEVIRQVGAGAMPQVVFVTAHDAYAIQGFEVNAMDYLLKPFEASRFDATLLRVRAAATQQPVAADRLSAMLEQLGEEQRELREWLAERNGIYLERIMLYANGVRTFVQAADIRWIEAADNYSRLHASEGEFLHRISLRELEARLDPRRFVRIHRSTIVNMECVSAIRPWFSGDQVLTLQDGTELKVSRTYRERLLELG